MFLPGSHPQVSGFLSPHKTHAHTQDSGVWTSPIKTEPSRCEEQKEEQDGLPELVPSPTWGDRPVPVTDAGSGPVPVTDAGSGPVPVTDAGDRPVLASNAEGSSLPAPPGTSENMGAPGAPPLPFLTPHESAIPNNVPGIAVSLNISN